MLQKAKVSSFLITVFLVSVIIRMPQITKDVKSHEQTYILTLQTAEIWRSEGIINCHFTPMWTYQNEGDKYMAYYKRLEDKKGNNYYVSFPPLSFMVAYLALLPFNIEDGKLILQLLNLLLHFVSAFLLYKIVCLLFKNKSEKLFLPAFISFLVYVFMPIMLFLHTDIFFPEMLGQVLWIFSLYVILKFKSGTSIKPFLITFLTFFLFLYAEWIAVFFFFTIFIYYIFSKEKNNNKNLLIISLTALFFAIVVMFIQYSSIAGISEMLHSMGLRYLERSGFFGQKYSSMGVHIFSLSSLILFALNFHKAMAWFGYLVILVFILFFIKRKKLQPDSSLILYLSIVPLLLHWIVFFNANAIHLLLMARIAVPLSLAAGFSAYLFSTYSNSLKSNDLLLNFNKCIGIILIIVSFLSYSIYFYNKDFTFPEKFPELNSLAIKIKNEALPIQSVFVISPSCFSEPEKFLTFKTKRNIVGISAVHEATAYLKKNKKEGESVIFILKGNGAIEKIIQ